MRLKSLTVLALALVVSVIAGDTTSNVHPSTIALPKDDADRPSSSLQQGQHRPDARANFAAIADVYKVRWGNRGRPRKPFSELFREPMHLPKGGKWYDPSLLNEYTEDELRELYMLPRDSRTRYGHPEKIFLTKTRRGMLVRDPLKRTFGSLNDQLNYNKRKSRAQLKGQLALSLQDVVPPPQVQRFPAAKARRNRGETAGTSQQRGQTSSTHAPTPRTRGPLLSARERLPSLHELLPSVSEPLPNVPAQRPTADTLDIAVNAQLEGGRPRRRPRERIFKQPSAIRPRKAGQMTTKASLGHDASAAGPSLPLAPTVAQQSTHDATSLHPFKPPKLMTPERKDARSKRSMFYFRRRLERVMNEDPNAVNLIACGPGYHDPSRFLPNKQGWTNAQWMMWQFSMHKVSQEELKAYMTKHSLSRLDMHPDTVLRYPRQRARSEGVSIGDLNRDPRGGRQSQLKEPATWKPAVRGEETSGMIESDADAKEQSKAGHARARVSRAKKAKIENEVIPGDVAETSHRPAPTEASASQAGTANIDPHAAPQQSPAHHDWLPWQDDDTFLSGYPSYAYPHTPGDDYSGELWTFM